MKKRIYCILYDDDIKAFDVAGPVYDDTEFTEKVAEKNGAKIHCSTVWEKDVKSVEELKRDNDPPGYRYHSGLFEKHGIDI